MQYRTLGRTGLEVGVVGFGGATVGIPNYLADWDPTDPESQRSVVRALDRALDLGLNLLDTAPGYGDGVGESIYGQVVGRRRDECIVSTKCGARHPDGIRESCEASLRRLQTDVIDVYQFHGGWYEDAEVEQILSGGGLATFEALREEGKVRFLGFTAEAPTGGVSKLIASGRFDVLQIRYNLMYQHACDYVNNRGVMHEAEAAGMGITVMRPLTSGAFWNLMAEVAPELSGSLNLYALLLQYVLSNPHVDTAIVGMRQVEEVERNVAVADDLDGRLDLAAVHHRFRPTTKG